MPIYEYVCKVCGDKSERLLSVHEVGTQQFCQSCGSLLNRLVSNASFRMLTRQKAEVLSRQFGRQIESDADLRKARGITSVAPQGNTIEMSRAEFERIRRDEGEPFRLDKRKFREKAEMVRKRLFEDENFRLMTKRYQEQSLEQYERFKADAAQGVASVNNKEV